MTEVELGCNSDVQYGKWMAACRLAAKGKTMADPTYDVEVAGIKTFVSMQQDNRDETDNPAVDNSHIQCEDFVPPRLLNRMKSKQVRKVKFLLKFLASEEIYKSLAVFSVIVYAYALYFSHMLQINV